MPGGAARFAQLDKAAGQEIKGAASNRRPLGHSCVNADVAAVGGLARLSALRATFAARQSQGLHLSAFKKPQGPCGDAIMQHRSDLATDISLCDGIGSGYKAHIAAEMCISRLKTSLESGISMQRSFSNLASTLNLWRSPDMPYAAFSLARILNDGETNILSYDTPSPILISSGHACVLLERPLLANETIAKQSSCFLIPGESLLLVSDGVTQAGIGNGLQMGWGIKGVADYITELLKKRISKSEISDAVCRKAFELCGCKNIDDISVVQALCRKGKTVTLSTGPPINENKDEKVFVTDFSYLKWYKSSVRGYHCRYRRKGCKSQT